MLKATRLTAICLLGLSGEAYSGATLVDSIHQAMPSGAVNSEQVLIIENDAFGNQRILSIGHPGGVITRPRPCKRDEPVAGMDCTGKDLRGVRWDGAQLAGSQFDGADLRGASLTRAQLVNASFNDARLDAADLSGAGLINCDFNNASLSGARLNDARIVNADFMDADLTGTDMTGADMINVEFMAARLDGAKWIDGRLCGQGSVESCRISRSQRGALNMREANNGTVYDDSDVVESVQTNVQVNRLHQSQSGRLNKQKMSIGSVD